MTRKELVDLVLARVGRREEDPNMRSYAEEELQQLQFSYERGLRLPNAGGVYHPWFLVAEIGSSVAPADLERIKKPSKFIAEVDDGGLWLKDGDGEWEHLPKDDYDILRSQFPDSGKPKAYADTGDYWRLFPTPDKEYTVEAIIYQGEPALVNDGDTNEWTTKAGQLMLAGLGRVMAGYYLYNSELMQIFSQDENQELRRLYHDTIAREFQARDLRMGGRSQWQ